MSTITAANAVLIIGVTSLFPVPQQLQGFAVDDIYDVGDITPAEVQMGADGNMSAGFVFVPTVQNFSLQADSPSIVIFEALYAAQLAAKEVYFLFGTTRLASISRTYVMTKGVLTGYKPMPDGKRVLQPRRFAITWESVIGAPL